MSRRSGFTLTEILVVLAILAILAALLFPVFMRAKGRAQETRCASNLRQMYLAMELYRQEWESEGSAAHPVMGYPPPEALGEIQWKLFHAGWEICPASGALEVPIGYLSLPTWCVRYAEYAEREGPKAYVIVDYNHNEPSSLGFMHAHKTIRVMGIRADGSLGHFSAQGSMSDALGPFLARALALPPAPERGYVLLVPVVPELLQTSFHCGLLGGKVLGLSGIGL